MAKYELVVTSDNVLSSPLTLTVLDIVGPRGETGPTGPAGPAGATTFSSLTDVDTDSATIGQLLQADGDDTYSFVTVAGATNTLDDVTSNNNTTTNDISVGGVTATSLNTHTIPGGTGTLALSSDIPTVPTNNNQLTNGAGYITDYTVTQGDVTSHQAALSITESQVSDLGTYLTAETNDLSSAVTWANVPDANITQSSVTQHQAALSITESQVSDLQSYITGYTVTEGDVTAHQAALSITESQISDHGTYATLVGGTVPASQLPSYVDDVEEYATYAGFPGTGEAGKIYVDIATGDIYRWSGSGYVQVNDAVSSADQATRLATARTISLGGDVTGSASFDGTADITITAAVADDSHDHTIANVDGLQTALDGKLASTSTTDNITEGSSNLYYTDARANSAFDIRIATKDTDDLSEGSTNLYYTNARFDTQLATKDTDDLSEGSNQYYTDARVLTKINATSIDALNDVDTTTATPSDGQVLTWDNTAGYWKPSTVSGGGGGGSGDITSVVAGSGLTGGASTGDATLNVGAGSFITVAADTVAVDATDANTASKVVARDASGNFSASTITASLTGNVTGTVSDVSNHDTDDITEGSTNLYYTDARFNTAFSGKSTSDLSEGTNLYYTNARADARVAAATGVNLDLANQDTDDLSEGSTNLYYTDTRANAAIDARVDEDFINALNVDAASADTLTFTVKNSTGATLEKGSVVYVSGLNGNTPEVSLARANSSSTMPAFGLVGADIANTADGTVDTFGSLTGLNVADFGETGITFSLGDTVYVSSSEAGKLTNVAPSGEANLIQNIGKIERATPTTNMTIKVGGAGRTNATPNLNDGNIFIGDSNNKAVTSGLDSEVRSRVSASFSGGDGAFSYDNSTGVFTHTGPSAAETRAHFTGGTGVTITNGEVAIGQAVGTGSDVTFNDVTVSNNLTVNGSTTTIDSTTVAVTDSLFKLAKDNTADSLDAGWYGVYNDGTEKYAGIARDASDSGKFILYDGLQVEPTTTVNTAGTGFNKATLKADIEGDVTGNVTGTVSSLSNHDTGDLAEGTNLYYTDARADARVNLQTGANLDLSSKSTTNLSEGTNLYYTQARFDTAFGNKNTSDLSEGTNLYYTDARADARVNLQTGTNLDLSSKSTTDLSEGTNLYYTDARVDGHLNQSNPTDGYVLSWTNNDYAWVAQSGGSGSIQSEEFPTVTNGSANVTMSQSYALTHIEVYLNGVKLRGGASNDYDVSGTTLTFSENLQSGDVVCVVSLESASTFTISGTFANLTDTSVGSQASNTLIKYNGSAYVPTSLSEDSSGNVTSLVAGDSGNVSVDIRKANVRTTTGTVDLVGGASLYNAGAAATYSCANLNKGDIVTVYAAAASVAVVPGASTSLFKDGNDITGTSETSVAIGQHTIATITMISDTVAIIAGSDLT